MNALKPRKALKWEETKTGEYGRTTKEILAEFQACGLSSKGSNEIVENGIKIGKKLKYICPEKGCEFAARLILLNAPNTESKVETSSKMMKIFFKLIGVHNHDVTKNLYCPKKLAQIVEEDSMKRPKEILKHIRKGQDIPKAEDQDEANEDDHDQDNEENHENEADNNDNENNKDHEDQENE